MTTVEAVAAHFDAEPADPVHAQAATVEGLPGVVVIEHEGRRRVGNMTWGFPRIDREMRERGDPPGRIGLVADLTNAIWNKTVAQPRFRCLIAITHFANPNGIEGEKTRTWFSVKNQPIVAWAGFWRNLADVGPVYAGMTMTANEAVMPTNDRMPVLLDKHDYERWLHGSISDVIGFQFRAPFHADRLVVEQTKARWRSDGLPSTQLGLL